MKILSCAKSASLPLYIAFFFSCLLATGCSAPVDEGPNGVTIGEGAESLVYGGTGFLPNGGGGVPQASPSVRYQDSAGPDTSGEGTGELLLADENDADEGGGTGFGDDDIQDASSGGPVAYECEIGDVEECITPCGSVGTMECGKSWGPCIPPSEVCNELDDDCDGLIDEDLLNVCGDCDDLPPEVCNGFDDDCDGVVDEGVSNACGLCGPVPTESCNGFDDDCDGQVDEGLTNACGLCGPVPSEVCNGIDDDCDGQVDEGVQNACGGCGQVGNEVCNGVDDDCDGQVDEGVKNACGYCGTLPQEVCNGVDDDCDGKVDEGVKNDCGACGPVNVQELCNNKDDDCDGQVDEDCFCEVEVDLSGDCLTVKCPNKCPYPIGCDVDFDGDDPRGCIASKSDEKTVYFQEGNSCGAGSVSGVLFCSSVEGNGLTKSNCKMNKEDKFYVSKPSKCPDT